MASDTKQMVTRAGIAVPRRICVDLQTPNEAAIRRAVQSVEQAPAHPRMTDAVLLLAQALEAVADAEEALNPNLVLSTPTPAADGEREPWVIWSHEHRAYWRAERLGYCDFLIGAGVYSEDEAKALAAEVSRDPSKRNEARSLTSELARASTGTIGAYLAALRAGPLPADDEPTLAKANAWADDIRLSCESRTHKPWSREGHLIVEIQAQLRDARAALGLRPGEPLRAVLIKGPLPDDVRAAVERVRRNLCGDHSDFECAFGDHVVETRDLRTLLAHLQRTEGA